MLKKQLKLQKGVEDIMGGKVLELPSDREKKPREKLGKKALQKGSKKGSKKEPQKAKRKDYLI